MAVTDLPIFSALRDRMAWHQTRQTLLAENIANAETPGYRGRDLAPFSIDDGTRPASAVSVATRTTNARHFSVAGSGAISSGARPLNSFEVTPEGNGVTLEDEMMKLSTNQMDYQAATTLYTRSMRLLKIALGRPGE